MVTELAFISVIPLNPFLQERSLIKAYGRLFDFVISVLPSLFGIPVDHRSVACPNTADADQCDVHIT